MKCFSGEPWHGPTKIILGIDIGTTHSAVSFAHLYEGGPQRVQHVIHWPGQPNYTPSSKIPTAIYYDQENKPMCFGADVLKPDNRGRAEDEGWSLAKHFKLHLHPRSMQTKQKLQIEPLPFGVSLATIYKDFLRFLLQHTQTHFEDSMVNGKEDWEKYSTNMLIVLTHPNGWSIREQQFLRKALYDAAPSYRSCQVTFVTEGEASVHFSMFHSGMGANLRPDTTLVVCDAGGSTVDTTTYYVEQTVPILQVRECKASACIQTGGIFVDLECANYMAKLLSGMGLEEEAIRDLVSAAVTDFEANVKKEFIPSDTSYSVNFYDNSLKNVELQITRGRVKLAGRIIQSFFDGVVSDIVKNVKEQIKDLSPDCLLLVGGFGQNQYLRRQVSDSCNHQVAKIDSFTSKAAADGAVIWATGHAVVGRIARESYGLSLFTFYDASNPDHQGRPTAKWVTGEDVVGGSWSPIINKGELLTGHDIREYAYRKGFTPGGHSRYYIDLWVFRGDPGVNPGWVKDKNGMYNWVK